jgi:hypothetical protein
MEVNGLRVKTSSNTIIIIKLEFLMKLRIKSNVWWLEEKKGEGINNVWQWDARAIWYLIKYTWKEVFRR